MEKDTQVILAKFDIMIKILIKKHNQLCDTIGESAFIIDMKKEFENIKLQSSINQTTNTINELRKEAKKEMNS